MEVENFVQEIKQEEPLEIVDYLPFEDNNKVIKTEPEEELDHVNNDIPKVSKDLNSKKKKVFKCELCDEICISRKLLSSHSSEKHQIQQIIKCKKCDKVFDKIRSLQLHMSKTHKLECKHCKEFFPARKPFIEHFFNIHKILVDGAFKCIICDSLFTFKKPLLMHMRKMHSHKCEHCGKSFKTMKFLSNHLSKVHEINMEFVLKCNKCDKNFSRRSSMMKHMKHVHKLAGGQYVSLKTEKIEADGQKIETVLKCIKCDKTFVKKRSLQQHIINMHKLACQHCEQLFNTKDLMDKHCSEVHGTKCFFCKGSTDNPETLQLHLKAVHSQCNICEKFYMNETRLKEHMRRHKFICEQCGLEVQSPELLKAHYAEKHECKFCKEVLSDEAMMKDHVAKMHVQCEICGESCMEEGLVAHIKRRHSYKCHLCLCPLTSNKHVREHYLEKHGKQVTTVNRNENLKKLNNSSL